MQGPGDSARFISSSVLSINQEKQLLNLFKRRVTLSLKEKKLAALRLNASLLNIRQMYKYYRKKQSYASKKEPSKYTLPWSNRTLICQDLSSTS